MREPAVTNCTGPIDLHNHVIPRSILDEVRERPAVYAPAKLAIEQRGAAFVLVLNGRQFPVDPELFDPDRKVDAMERKGIYVTVVSPAPLIFLYGLDANAGLRAARITNDGVARMVAARPDRLRGMATLPMQDPDAAIAELERVVEQHGFRAVEVGAAIGDVELCDKRLRRVLKRMEELDVVMFTHSSVMASPGGRLDCYYLANIIGNPLDTTVMATKLMLSGALDDLKELRILLAHGGGYLPYQVGRLEHGHDVRSDTSADSKSKPLAQLRRFWFDALTHHPQATRHLLDMVGSDRVVLGTDSPYDMGEERPIAMLDAVPGLTANEREDVACRTALHLFKGKL